MAAYYERTQVTRRLRRQIQAGESILIMGCGSGISAVSAEEGGVDLISVYSTAVMRMDGVPTAASLLPYSDCNAVTYRKAEQLLPLVKNTPCLAGVGAHAPFLDLNRYLDELKSLGFSGIVNEPFVAGYGAEFAANLERAGCGFSREVELIRQGHEKGLFSVAWCSNSEEARRMTEAGADMIGVVLFGKYRALDEALDALRGVTEAARDVSPEVFTIAHGGPFHDVETARAAVQSGCVDGYACGSNGEKNCAEQAIRANVESYRHLK